MYDAKPFVVDSEGGDSGYMAVNLEDYLVGDSPTAYMFLQDGFLNSQASPQVAM